MQQHIGDFESCRIQAPDSVVQDIGKNVHRSVSAEEGGSKYTLQVFDAYIPYKGILGDIIDIIPVDEELVTYYLAVKDGNEEQ